MTVADRGTALGSLYIEAQSRAAEVGPERKPEVDRVFKALADCTRRRILCLLRANSQSVTDIVEHFHLTQPSISRHLAILKGAGLVAYTRQGQRMIYRLGEPEAIELAMAFLTELNGLQSALPAADSRSLGV